MKTALLMGMGLCALALVAITPASNATPFCVTSNAVCVENNPSPGYCAEKVTVISGAPSVYLECSYGTYNSCVAAIHPVTGVGNGNVGLVCMNVNDPSKPCQYYIAPVDYLGYYGVLC